MSARPITFKATLAFNTECIIEGCNENILITEDEMAKNIEQQTFECPGCGYCYDSVLIEERKK